MNKLGLLAFASQAAPRLFQVRRRTWILFGFGLLALFGLVVWAAIALIGWFFGQLQNWGVAAPGVAGGVLTQVERQVEQVVPGAREAIADYVPILRAGERPERDVSGQDFAPVARYPGLTRSYWHREGRQISVQYEGRAEYVTVLEHYVKGFSALGYTQNLQSATPETETHAWVKGSKRYLTRISTVPRGEVSVRIETTLQ